MTKPESVAADGVEATIPGFPQERAFGEGPANIDRDANLLTGGSTDSVGLVRWIADIEEKLGM